MQANPCQMTNLLTLLACISMIESNDNDQAIGKAGEISRYQIMPLVWCMFTMHSIGEAENLRRSKPVAKRILEEQIKIFKFNFRRDPTTREIYLLWNCPAKVMRPSKKALATAIRFENLVKEKMKGEAGL